MAGDERRVDRGDGRRISVRDRQLKKLRSPHLPDLNKTKRWPLPARALPHAEAFLIPPGTVYAFVITESTPLAKVLTLFPSTRKERARIPS